MHKGVVYVEELTIHVVHRDSLAAELHRGALTRLQFTRVEHFDILAQSRVSPGLDTLMAYALNELPQPHDDVAFGLLNTKPRPMISSLKSIVVPLR